MHIENDIRTATVICDMHSLFARHGGHGRVSLMSCLVVWAWLLVASADKVVAVVVLRYDSIRIFRRPPIADRSFPCECDWFECYRDAWRLAIETDWC